MLCLGMLPNIGITSFNKLFSRPHSLKKQQRQQQQKNKKTPNCLSSLEMSSASSALLIIHSFTHVLIVNKTGTAQTTGGNIINIKRHNFYSHEVY